MIQEIVAALIYESRETLTASLKVDIMGDLDNYQLGTFHLCSTLPIHLSLMEMV